jgi:preprotein translocase subunit SecG
MMAFVIVLHVIACLTLIIFILLQAGKGHGLAGSSFGSEMNTVFGTRTAQFMTKLTSACAILFLVTCLAIDVLISRGSKSLLDEDIQKGLTQEQMDQVMVKLKELQDKEAGIAGDVAAVGEEAKAVTEKAADVADAVGQETVDTAGAVQEKASADLGGAVDKIKDQASEAIPVFDEEVADVQASAESAVSKTVAIAEDTAADATVK